MMTCKWTEEDITSALKKMAEVSLLETPFDKTWLKIDEKLSVRKNHFWNHIIWKPWNHPIRWVMVTACLCVASTGLVYHANSVDQSDMDSYLISISNPTENIVKDLGVANVSVLLSEPSSSVLEVKVDDHLDSIAADEVLL
ncbi:MAG TPA: hypothetical protein VN963_07675 [bacterium]|nr:hypothetical protein [bacterium]